MSINARLHSAGFPLRNCNSETNNLILDYCQNIYPKMIEGSIRVITIVSPLYDSKVESAFTTIGRFFLEKNFDVRYVTEIPSGDYEKIYLIPVYDRTWDKFLNKIIASGGFAFIYSSESINKPFFESVEIC